MISTLKASAFGAFLADSAVMVYAAMQSAPLPDPGTLVGAGGAGAAASLAVLYAWKGSADKRIEKMEADKADRAEIKRIEDALREMRDDIRYLVRSKKEGE